MQRGSRQAKKANTLQIASGVTPYSLRLYVAGSNLKSTQAVQIARKLCAAFPAGRCKLEVIDLYQQPDLAKQDNIVAIPSLVKIEPPPRRAFVGITQDTQRILLKLGLPIIKDVNAKAKGR